MIFLFPRWDMLIPWRLSLQSSFVTDCYRRGSAAGFPAGHTRNGSTRSWALNLDIRFWALPRTHGFVKHTGGCEKGWAIVGRWGIDNIYMYIYIYQDMHDTKLRIMKSSVPTINLGINSFESASIPGMYALHPAKLTWNPKMEVWKMFFSFNWVIFKFQLFIFQGVDGTDIPIF